MKTIFTILALACSFVALAQGNVKITGSVMDSTTSKGVEFATVAVLDAAGKAVDGTVCDDKGEFSLKVAPGKYKLSITFIGFETKTIAINTEDRKDLNLGKISFSPTTQQLKEVTVEGQRAIIEERVDRTVYNAENDATAKGGDATDVLKRVPLLSVDMDGNVSLRGNSNIQVLINNKPSSIVASSVADALKQIPADEIKTVEVITSPSAKYDAEGSGGIINIITKKNNLQGLTLNVDAGVGLRGSNLGLNGNYRKGKMGFSLGGWGRANYNVNGSFRNEQTSLDEDGNPTSTSLQTAESRNSGMFGRYNLGWDYDIDKNNVLAASVRFGVRNNHNYQDNLFNQQSSADGTIVGTSLRDAKTENVANNVDVSLTYTHLYTKPQRELSFQALYSRDNQNSDFLNTIYNVSDLSTNQRVKNLNDSYNQEMTLQLDYQTPIGTTQMFEIGGKQILRKAVSDFTYFTASGSDGDFVLDTRATLNNNLNYDQSVMAGYLSYTLSMKNGYSLKAGSRYEYTTIGAYTRTEDDIDIPSYGVIVPSVNISKKLKGGNMLKASYNRRIQRPSIRFLNPNIQASNPLNITIGNPRLNPEYTNNYELSYSTFIKGTTLNFSGFVRNTNDGIQSIRDIIGNRDDNVPDTLRTQYGNIGQENAYGLSTFANVTVGKLSLNGGGDVFYATLDNQNSDPAFSANNEGWVASGRIFGSYDLSKGWGFQFFSFIRGRQVQLQGTQGGFYMYSLSIRKEFNEKRGSIGIGAENFLQKNIKIKGNLESPQLIQNSLNTMNNASIRLNFSYRIGKMSMENKPRRRRSINNDDLKDGGDGGDGGAQMGGGGAPGGAPAGGGAPVMGGGQRPQGAQQPATPVPQIAAPTDGTKYEAAGTWALTIESPQQPGSGSIVIKNDNGIYSGTIKTERMPQETAFKSVTVEGNAITMTYEMTFNGNTVPVEIKATFSQTDLKGAMNFGGFRTMNISGKKSN